MPDAASRLPARPSLEQLRKQAKERLIALRGADPAATLADAQYALARDYGFESWPRLCITSNPCSRRLQRGPVPRPRAEPRPATRRSQTSSTLLRTNTASRAGPLSPRGWRSRLTLLPTPASAIARRRRSTGSTLRAMRSRRSGRSPTAIGTRSSQS
jgi:hypothetical protein